MRNRDLYDVEVERLFRQVEKKEQELNAKPRSRFRAEWSRLPLPVRASVAIIDQGGSAVGLSAVQFDALGVGNGIVRLARATARCDAKVWNACGISIPSVTPNASASLTPSTEELGCSEGDEIDFIEVVVRNLPVRID